MDSLLQKAGSGVFWSAVQRFGDQGVRFIVGLILARLLAPAHFGLLAMVSVFVALGTAFSDGGFSQAIIQRKDSSQTDLSSVFFFNVFLGILTAGLLWLVSPAVAHFYGQPELTELLRYISIVVILATLSQVHLAQLTKLLQFRLALMATFPATVISGCIAVALAFAGWGVWALVYQAILQRGLQSLFLWFASPWRPTFSFSLSSLKSMFSYGSRLMAAGFIHQVFENIYVLVIGRFFPAAEVGFYHRAQSFNRMGAQNLTSIVGRVLFPVYASIQDDSARMRRAFGKSLFLLGLTCFPLMALLAGVAEPLIITLIGKEWLPAVPYLQLLCVVGALYPIHAANLSVLKALGESRLFLRVELIKKAMALGILLITFWFGITAIIVGQILASLLALWINSFYNRRLIRISYREQMSICLVPVTLAFGVFVVAGAIVAALPGGGLVSLICGSAAGLALTAAGIFTVRYRIRPELELLLSKLPAGQPVRRWLFA